MECTKWRYVPNCTHTTKSNRTLSNTSEKQRIPTQVLERLPKCEKKKKNRDHSNPNADQNQNGEHQKQKEEEKEMKGSFSIASAAATSSALFTVFAAKCCHNNLLFGCSKTPSVTNNASFLQLRPTNKFLFRVANDSKQTELRTTDEVMAERSEVDRIVDGMDFGDLCNEFECISSPLVEATARQLVRDILELRQGNRALGSFATSVKYKDPVRSFIGRDKYKRPLWATQALDNPRVRVQEMVMLSTSLLSIKWTLTGKPKSLIGGALVVKIRSMFTLNQISGQVIEHEELWDLSESPFLAQAYFWATRRLFAANEAGKDVVDFVKDLNKRFTTDHKNAEMYPDPSGDPTKFFQRDDSFQRDAYQIALFLAVLYLIVQFLKTTL